MPKKTTDAIVVHCIDFRLQEYLNHWLLENIGPGNYDRVSLAGGVFDLEAIFKQVEISERLHEIKKVVFINHEDCGAYGEAGTKERHEADLRAAREKIRKYYSHIDIELHYLSLAGEFEGVL
ncbi:MAG: hypothetical protein GY755_20950 [Chloroflexi bacterium]|nr:hypothetical protein [Chloroflexota bacterium]